MEDDLHLLFGRNVGWEKPNLDSPHGTERSSHGRFDRAGSVVIKKAKDN